MRRKIANEEVKKILKNAVEEIHRELDAELKIAQAHMCVAEEELVKSLDENQRALYNEFYKKREIFYLKASEPYKRVDQ